MMRIVCIGVMFLILLLTSCRQEDKRPVGKQGWLRGTQREKFETIARHLRGNDVVMWEVRRRHIELYHAILQKNQAYALYQLDKIVLAMKMGAVRRPKRKPSYDWFFSHAVPPMKKALQRKDQMLQAFQAFTASCVTCHTKEQVSFIPVQHPWRTPPK